jgi:hypothetical protein
MSKLEQMTRRRKEAHAQLVAAKSKAGGPGTVSARFALEVMDTVFAKSG